ncbi:MAG TPA: HipA domain-containing protein [Acidimicrobiia bacterium]|jgi:serine/threonine-protein kinase HipA
MAGELAVWLYEQCVALIDRDRDRLRLTYTDEALDRYPLGSPLLSLSMPVGNRRYTQGIVRPFLDGLLPEGDSRAAIARDVGVSPTDTYGLIRELGRDCAGAIVVQPAEQSRPQRPTTTTAEPLDDETLARLVGGLRSAPLGVDGRVRISLAGVQEKLVLTKLADGRWGRPVDGTPSTHILKPEIATFPHTVQNEAFCMRVARYLGLVAANVETTQVGNRQMIVVERFDRRVIANSDVERIHQEDFCQATGIAPEAKYEANGGPSLRRIAGILGEVAEAGSVDRLLAATTVNALLGNGDAHAKNFSLLHNPSGALTLAPLYDLVSTLYYGDDRLAMYVDNVRRIDRVTVTRLVNEAVSWGVARDRATGVIGELLDKAPEAIERARDETADLPAGVVGAVEHQLQQLRSEG